MKFSYHKLRKFFLSIFIVFEIFAIGITPVYAGIFGSVGKALGGAMGMSAADMLSGMEKRYNIDRDALKDFGENVNVSNQKSLTPTVRIVFSPQDPKPGQKITARAFPMFFKNPPEQLYYTWYLKRGKCPQGNVNKGAYDAKDSTVVTASCDRDGNGTVDINDYKIEAARALAGNGFYPDPADTGGQEDNDGYIAYPGGDLRNNLRNELDVNPYYYYLADNVTGKTYEILKKTKFTQKFPTCVSADDIIAQYGTLVGHEDEITGVPTCVADSILECPAKIEAEGGEGGSVSVQGGAGGTDGGAGGAGGGAEGKGGKGGSVQGDTYYKFPYCMPLAEKPQCLHRLEGAGQIGDTGRVVCPEGSIPVCITDPDTAFFADSKHNTLSEVRKNLKQVGRFNQWECADYEINEMVKQRNSGVKWNKVKHVPANEGTNSSARTSKYGQSYLACTLRMNKAVKHKDLTQCELGKQITTDDPDRFHLFPRNANGDQVGEGWDQDHLGDQGKFLASEEEFYGTDPYDPDTADNRTNDEATVVGVGQNAFSWLYSPGDEVGVVVEGQSILTTKHEDASQKIMFATVNNVCDYSDMRNKGVNVQLGNYTAPIKGKSVTIPTVGYGKSFENAFNKCLNDSSNEAFVNPTQGGAAKRLDIHLTYTPDNPINDEQREGDNYLNIGDTITVDASVNNATYDDNRLLFDWRILRSKDGTANFDPVNWEEIATAKDHKMFSHITPMHGNDLGRLEFLMNLKESDLKFPNNQDHTYIKVRVNIEEDFDLLAKELYKYNVNRGVGEVIIRITRASNRLMAYVMPTGDIAKSDNSKGDLICNQNMAQSAVCPIVKNQIIRIVANDDKGNKVADYKNFAWKLDGKPMYCNSDLGNCDGTAESAYNYLAATGDIGTRYTVTMSANKLGTSEDGGAVELTRVFEIVDPYVAFCEGPNSMEDGGEALALCKNLKKKELGIQKTDKDNTGKSIYAENVFYANTGSDVYVAGTVRPSWINNPKVNWFANNILVGTGEGVNISGTDTKPGDIINVTARVSYDQEKGIRELLRTIWHVTDEDIIDQSFSEEMQIQYVDDVTKVSQLSAPQAFMAALGVNAPGIVIFLFRTFLAVSIIVFIFGVIWRFASTTRRQ